MTSDEAIAYIHSVGKHRAVPGLDSFRAFLEKLGNPQEKCKFIHVAGTNGKGSVCAMTDSILRAAGYKIGLYTSPFILNFRERIRLNGEMISEERLAELTEKVRKVAEESEEKPTEFELITAVAFLFYAEEQPDAVVLEVGLGGRWDPTNVISKPLLSVISGIALDHMNVLGNTTQKIAAEKAGILKEGCPGLYGGEGDSPYRVLKTVADARHCPFYTVDRRSMKVREMTLDGTVLDFGDYTGLELPLLGTYQCKNVTTVLTALDILKDQGWEIPEKAIREGLKNVRWMARFEVISRKDPIVIFDGSHNPQGISAAVKSIQTYFPDQKVNVLSGVMGDKDYDGIIESIRPIAEQVFTVAPDNSRALGAEDYAEVVKSHRIPAQGFEDLTEGVRAAVKSSREANLPLICLGSLYLYRELTVALKEVLSQ